MIQRLRHPDDKKRRFAAVAKLWAWVDAQIIDLGRQMRVTYLPPLMVYMAAGVSGLTSIVGTFFVKDYLGLSAEFLAMLGFWAGMPWALKMPLGHLVDLLWRWKSVLVVLGASLIGISLVIMLGLLGSPALLGQYMSVSAWYVLSALLAPLGYVIQDVVADAMTVEAVPTVDDAGQPYAEHAIKQMHTTMQTLGRVAIVGGGMAVSLVNIFMFGGVETMPEAMKAAVYIDIYRMALLIPVISVLGVIFAAVLKRVRARRLRRQGFRREDIVRLLEQHVDTPHANWWILDGSFIFVLFTWVSCS
jgi:hypothetical protein